jgi:cytochrome c biogenesis protein CcmG/thiol:disulfide interchange protein DsbE
MRAVLILMALALVLSIPMAAMSEEEPEWDGITFELENLDGDDVNEADVFTGADIYLVDFWASWCRPCNQYLPHLEEIVDEFGDKGLKVIIFVVDEAGTISSARTTLEAADYPFTILFDPEADVKDDLGVRQIPTTVIFSPEGEELWRHTGYAAGNEEEVRDEIVSLLPEEE